IFTTPPLTRKRKAAEAAITDQEPSITATEVSVADSRTATRKTSSNKRSTRRKDKLTDQDPDTDSVSVASASITDQNKQKATDLVTPASTSMDSDDDFMTDASSADDFLDTQGSDDESLGEEFGDEFDGGFSQDKDLLGNTKKPYEVDFRVLSPEDIDREQSQQVNEVSQILGLPPESSAILLRFGRWNREKLIESYMDHPEETLEEAGLGTNFDVTPKTEVVPGFMCDICCEDGDDLETYAMRCGHRFCVDCYRHYLAQKIREEGEAARIECPGDGCHMIVDSKSLSLLVADDLKERYQTLLMRTYVDDKENLKWCPAPNCEYAVDCPVKQRDLNRIVPTVQCACKHFFCFGCTLNDHLPSPCTLVKMWLKKCEDDSETANWISANTKECPKCHSTIEKNGGCNHMTCRKCKHEFCWMCMGLWSEHGTSWYNCNRYEEKSGSEARSAQAKSRASLERYLHYYNRYANHEQSAKLDKDLYLKTEKKMTSLQSQSGLSWIEVQFLDTASQALQQCRQTLKWTYAFAYYLARNNLTEIFEDNQKDLELAVESLSEMFEKPVPELANLKVDILDKTAYCNKRRVILLSDTAQKLKQGVWSFNVECYEALPSNYGLGRNMLAGAFAGIMEHAVMYPVDLLKTRMQVLHPTTGGLYTGLTNAVSTIYRIEGWRTLWKGVSSVIVGAGPAHAVYFGTYEVVKEMAGGNVDEGHHPLAAAASGAAATIASDALMNPFDVIKQRMQVHGSVHKSLLQCATSVYRTEGLHAFYVSYPTTLCMTVPFTATQFVAYESISKVMNPSQEYDPFTHCIAGGLAGAFAAGLTTPLDVVKTLLQTRGLAQNEEIRSAKGLFNAAAIIKRQFGWRGFLRGARPRIISTMPSTAICWTSYEMAKAYFKRQE
ncbi:hypothetical protein GB937_003945, partial [Aspergillus fischeri]